MVLLTIYILLKSLMELGLALYDQTHYHVKAFKSYALITFFIPIDYMWFIWRFYYTHVCHMMYLQSIGLLDTPNLVDSGSFVSFKDSIAGHIINTDTNDQASGFFNNASGNPSHLPLSSIAMDQLWAALEAITPLEGATFLDFGCGTGFPLLSAMTKPLGRIVGVDLHEGSTIMAKTNTQRFATHHAVKCSDVSIFCQDMLSFNEYPDANMTILFMYEPLWTIPKPTAHPIYKAILEKAKEKCHNLIIAYFFAGLYDGDCLPALEEVGAKLVYEEKYEGLFFGANDHLYIYSVPCTSPKKAVS